MEDPPRATPPRRGAGLSKSRITAFEQCARKLWLSVHRPDLATVDDAAMARFQSGHRVGALACAIHPDGVMVEAELDLATALVRTRDLIDTGHPGPIFEATFAHDGVLVRIDLLERDATGHWCIAEVKSTTGVKAYHWGDLATQFWVLDRSGVPVSGAVIRHIDNQFVLESEGDYRGLFTDAPLLDLIKPLVDGRDALVAKARAVLSGSEPSIDPGPHCSSPFSCEFTAHCGRDLPPPPQWPIAELPRTGAAVAAHWADNGVFDLRDVPEGGLRNPIHQRIHTATITDTPYHDREGARVATEGWAWPRGYLDFETIGEAIPRWIGARPFQAIPFQFSCHIQTADHALTHSAFLSVDSADPRRACAEALVHALGGGKAGSIIAYNAPFERSCIRGLALHCPDLADALSSIEALVVDLLPVTRAHYYHPRQRGSWSIKAVLPALVPELGYQGLDVSDGQAAQQAWLEAAAPETSPGRRSQIADALLAYCQLDTLAMVKVLEALAA